MTNTSTASHSPRSRRLPRLRLAARTLIDMSGWFVGVVITDMVRLQRPGLFEGRRGAWGVVIVVLIAGAVCHLTRMTLSHRYGRPPFASFEDALRVVQCNIAATLAVLIVSTIAEPHLVPSSAVIGGGLLACLFSFGARVVVRLRRTHVRRNPDRSRRTIVFGAGEGGQQAIDAMLGDPLATFLPVALLDDNPLKFGTAIRGVRVLGTRDDLERISRSLDATTLVIAIAGAGRQIVGDVIDHAQRLGLEVRVLPTVADLFGSPVIIDDIRPVTPNDLLGRLSVETDLSVVASYLLDKRVLVTGAGGSIGSELCRQLVNFAPSTLIMLDQDESALHALQLEMEGHALLDSRDLVIANVRDRDRMFEVMDEHRPDVVFHAAALKHQPILEMYPEEAYKSNIAGTRNVLDAAARAGVLNFVNISTDKAADPIGVLGYSKRIAEGLTAQAARGNPGTYLSVRFGNVLGSRGSVLTTFQEQITRGGPITVTDPEVTRYFMTVSEAVHLTLQAAAIGRSGEVLVLDMGEPVRIEDVARSLAARAPEPPEIVYTGLRPGEKLHECLFGPGEIDERPVHPRISHVTVPPPDPELLEILDGSDDTVMAMRCVTEQMACAAREQANQPRRFPDDLRL